MMLAGGAAPAGGATAGARAGGAGAAGVGGAGAGVLGGASALGLSESDVEQLRALRVGHNLASVMNNPNAAAEESSWFGSLTGMFERDDFFDSSALPIPSVVQPVELVDFEPYLSRNRAFLRRFLRNHRELLVASASAARSRAENSLAKRRSSIEGAPYNESVARSEQLQLSLAAAIEASSPTLPSAAAPPALSPAQAQAQAAAAQAAAAAAAARTGPGALLGADGVAASAIALAQGKMVAAEALRACSQQVPAQYFAEQFELSLDVPSSESHAAYLTQERLSNWLDLVEVTLWSQTTSQAEEFFNALSDLSVLTGHVRDACETITLLRRRIAAVQSSMVTSHLAVLARRRRKANAVALELLLSKVRAVRATVPQVDAILAGSQDYRAALELLDEARQVLATELQDVYSLRALHRQINDYEGVIVEQLGNKFVDLCVTWGDDSFGEEEEDSLAPPTGLDDEAVSHVPATAPASSAAVKSDALGAGMYPLVVGLLAARNAPMRSVLAQYRTRIINEVRSAAKNSVVESLAAMGGSAGGSEAAAAEQQQAQVQQPGQPEKPPVNSSAAQLSSLTPQAFLTFLSLVFDSLEMVMRRAFRVHTTLVACLERAQKHLQQQQQQQQHEQPQQQRPAQVGTVDGSSPEQGSLTDSLASESSESLARVCEMSQSSVQKLLAVRLAQHERLQLSDFKQLYDRVGAFSLRAERLGGPNTSIDLKGALRLAAKKFLATTHEHAMQALKAQLDEEVWKGVAAPREMQAIVNRMLSGRLSVSRGATEQPARAAAAGAAGAGEDEDKKKGASQLLINNKSFRVVSAVLPLLDYMERYLACAQQLSLSSACLPSLLELLRLFNERSNKLVLKAEAIRTAGLKQIGSRNLAYASHALSIVLALLPYCESVLVACLPRGSRHFDKDRAQVQQQLEQLAAEYEQHRERIFDKFVEMIDQRLMQCCGPKQLLAVDWDARAPQDIKPEAYMQELTTWVKNLHQSLAKSLPPEHLQLVFAKIFALFNKKVPELYATLQPRTAVGVSQVRVDLRNLAHCLRLLPGTTGAGDDIDRLANEKFGAQTVLPPPPAATAAAPVGTAAGAATIAAAATAGLATAVATVGTQPAASPARNGSHVARP